MVDLGWPIPTDSTVITPMIEANYGGYGLPLEAQREPHSGATEGTRRATRNPEPYSSEVGQSDSMDYLSSSPSSVVGVVAVPASPVRYAPELDDRPMNTFVPLYEATNSRVVAASMAENEASMTKMRLASQVSRELLSESRQPLGMAPLPVEPPTGWKNIEQELRDHLAKCDELLRRNAVLSAREEVLTGLRVLLRALDLRSGNWTSEPALDQALAAFAEESDFHQSLRNPTHAQSTSRIVAGHSTHALQQVDLGNVSPELAAQHYRAYARQQLAAAAQGHPWAADLLYALGKTYERRADSATEEGFMLRNQAVACYAAVLDVSPRHADGANQLGYSLLKLDRIDEAQSILTQATQTHPSADAWKNLAEVYRRRGQVDQAAVAIEHAKSKEMLVSSRSVPEVTQVSPQTFVGLSPNQLNHQSVGNSVQTTTASVPIVKAPSKGASWFSRLLR